jgi:hypothetical protein
VAATVQTMPPATCANRVALMMLRAIFAKLAVRTMLPAISAKPVALMTHPATFAKAVALTMWFSHKKNRRYV